MGECFHPPREFLAVKAIAVKHETPSKRKFPTDEDGSNGAGNAAGNQRLYAVSLAEQLRNRPNVVGDPDLEIGHT